MADSVKNCTYVSNFLIWKNLRFPQITGSISFIKVSNDILSQLEAE